MGKSTDSIKRRRIERRKFQVAWEAIRRTPDYKKDYELFCKERKKRGQFFCIGGEFVFKYKMIYPLDPNLKYSDLTSARLKQVFFHPSIYISPNEINKVKKSANDIVDLFVRIDLRKSASSMANGFKKVIQDIKRGKKQKTKKKEQVRVFGYYVDDFNVYDAINEIPTKKGKQRFYVYVNQEWKKKNKGEMPKGQQKNEVSRVRTAYGRAKVLIEKKKYQELL